MLSSLDTQITFFLSSILPHLPLFDFVSRLLSFEGSTVIMWIAVVIVVFAWEFYIRDNKQVFLAQLTKLTITLVIASAIAGGSVHVVIKPLVARVRPYIEHEIRAPHCPKDFSFPSGHATVAFAGAYILSKFDHNRRRRVMYALLALGVSYSRIYLLCHYAGDVLAGVVYGLAVAAISYEIIHRMSQTYKKEDGISGKTVVHRNR